MCQLCVRKSAFKPLHLVTLSELAVKRSKIPRPTTLDMIMLYRQYTGASDNNIRENFIFFSN